MSMGRIKTALVKRISNDLVSEYSEEFSTEFKENTKIAERYIEFPSKKLRNVIVGYVTRLIKKQRETA